MRIVLVILFLPVVLLAAEQNAEHRAIEIYQWIDAAGQTHYGDQPPEDTPVRKLDPAQSSLSVIGDSGLRESELALRRELDAASAARQQARLAERRQRQKARATAPVIINVVAQEQDKADRKVYYPADYSHYQPRIRYSNSRQGLSTYPTRTGFELQFGIGERSYFDLRYGDHSSRRAARGSLRHSDRRHSRELLPLVEPRSLPRARARAQRAVPNSL